ncbi:FAD-dependent oxidoreductase [Nocardioides marmoribigeumensis]|uniref:Assimilatory nitrate reductase electron transfer subunit n=1 Tax=Nocardioides marmoribigeumensis TaxID=433649 RepID=A0ABU2BZ15_9ACTN|nr:FAD-dependent oxidoreductase [Nocardioides marmoribigeumensis]MDR7363646.1 assimilatory nitrate reductase electron transfer subunit [Nocardioides marmoribigeumensis]
MTTRVVVVGAGMVGHRLAEELCRRDPEGRLDVRVVGAEAYEPYNRVLLSEVVAGRAAWRSLTLPELPARVEVRRSVAACSVDREARTVLLDDGTAWGWDHLVLATGAAAFVPPVAGLEERPRHVHVLRDLDDVRAVVSRSANARHAVVLGGGVLGLEVAAGLHHRGVGVTVLQVDPSLMTGQLDPAPAAVLARRLEESGVRVRTGTSVAEVLQAYGELVAVRLTDGTVMSTDLLVMSCGVRARTGLAADAGLPVDRGIVVGRDLASPADPRVHAIGDCAQEPGSVPGLVATGWDQAARLAARLVGAPLEEAPAVDDGSGDIRLKAVGVDLVALGVRASAALPEDRVITVDDPSGGRHLSLVVRGEHLVGATVLGAPAVAAEVSVALDRRTPLPRDPLALLTPERTGESTSPMRMPGATTVCRCNSVTKAQVVEAWEAGADSVEKVAARTRATTGCGGCREVVCGLVDWLASVDPLEPVPVPVTSA